MSTSNCSQVTYSGMAAPTVVVTLMLGLHATIASMLPSAIFEKVDTWTQVFFGDHLVPQSSFCC